MGYLELRLRYLGFLFFPFGLYCLIVGRMPFTLIPGSGEIKGLYLRLSGLFFCVAPLASMMMKNLENVTKNTLILLALGVGCFIGATIASIGKVR